MKVLIEISPGYYDRLLTWAAEESPVYSILKNGVKVQRFDPDVPNEVIEILCEVDEAHVLLAAARQFCPEAVTQIQAGIELSGLTRSK